ncbi:imidazole glycerol phosphate synthase subunit HisH [Telmatospirillum sp.]|uniref:imidazole glycerol phosphate synthase subunit HisH n=1 Tax=Telmatospirillum sp. TaxID=2079197 RepID=UPI00284D2FB1|nr:imidazole glycerol phosphate synthase subunit HisH [Telmatospirillum sp.]MDR3439622.1 imidazole glycerol phosphate synthase subunit HisH [Telmatospirillum sp.]
MSIVALIDYGSGNLRSAAKAFERAITEAGLDGDVKVTADPEVVRKADRIVLPGVGAFADCKRGLDALAGMNEALHEAVIERKRPFLGICVGMQLMAEWGREFGDHAGLGWIEGDVVPIAPADAALKIPHMGWNELQFVPGDHPLLAGLQRGSHAYFVHSFQFRPTRPAQILATVDYGGPLTAAVGRDNLVGTQFHPEKSQATGLMVITNFLRWRP